MAEKATIRPLDAQEQPTEPIITVHFNPQSLRLSYRTTGSSGRQGTQDGQQLQRNLPNITGFTSSLSVELIFDTTQTGDDVRQDTDKIATLIQEQLSDKPTVQFQWGTFLFKGVIQSMDETLDFFSESGVPLRSTVSLSLSGHRPEPQEAKSASAGAGAGGGLGAGLSAGVSAGFSAGVSAGVSAGFSAGISGGISGGFSAGAAVGTTPLALSQSGETLQGLAGRAGADWKAVAEVNGIDNPRQLAPGTVLNLNVKGSASLG